MPPKITFIGAGSTVFAKNLIGDILSFSALQAATLCLHDTDAAELDFSRQMAHRIGMTLGVQPNITTTTDRRTALEGADYVITVFQVGGLNPTMRTDFELPRKYGLRQTIGDTIGIGGIMRGLRSVPVMLAIARDMERLCPDALLLNYVNPMAIVTWAVQRATKIHTVGMSHSIPHTAHQLADDVGVPFAEVNFRAAGINHLAFFLTFAHQGRDLYPELWQIIKDGRVPAANRVRYDFLRHVGYFATDSSERLSEFVPYYIKRDRPDLIAALNIALDDYPRRLEAETEQWQRLQTAMQSADAPLEIDGEHEFAPELIHSLETNTARTIYCNVRNQGLIDNLPQGCVVEVPCLVDANGPQPIRIGALPPHLAALMQTNINVQMLTVEAALTRRREHIYHAAMLDPHTAAELDLDTIAALVDDLLIAHRDLLPAYS